MDWYLVDVYAHRLSSSGTKRVSWHVAKPPTTLPLLT